MRIAECILGIAIFVLIAVCFPGVAAVKAQNVEYVGSTLWNNCQNIAVRDNYAYAVYKNGLMVFDITDPGNPVVTGRTYAPIFVGEAIALYENYAYLAGFYYNIWIVDISDPYAPVLVGSIDTGSHPSDIFISGEYAYIVRGDNQDMIIFDISDPINPVFLGETGTPMAPMDVMVYGDYAYLAISDFGLLIFDISDPSDPISLGECEAGEYCIKVSLSENYAYLLDWYDLHIIDISDPADPSPVITVHQLYQPRDVFVSGDFAYVSQYDRGLAIIDISDPANPVITGEYVDQDIPRILPNAVFVLGNYAYLPDERAGIHLIDISDPIQPQAAGVFSTSRNVHSVKVTDNYAYVIDLTWGYHLVDISDPVNPVFNLTYSTRGEDTYIDCGASAIAILENRAFVTALCLPRLEIVDISIPLEPMFIGSWDSPDYLTDIFVSGRYAYVTDWVNGLHIVDIYDTANPVWISSYQTAGEAREVFVNGGYAYIPALHFGLHIIDVSDPANPVPSGAYENAGCKAAYVSGDYAYLVSRNLELVDTGGLIIIDVSEPTSPTPTGHCELPRDHPIDVFVSNNLAYIADVNYGIEVVNVADKYNPIFVDSMRTAGQPSDIFKNNDNLYLADRYSLMLLECSGATGCNYVAGDCNHNGTPLELGDVIAMIAMYRGSMVPPYECSCPPHGDNFTPTADPNGNCVALELGDVVTEIAAYRGTGQASGCVDCPGSLRLLPGEDQPRIMPRLKAKAGVEPGSIAE